MPSAHIAMPLNGCCVWSSVIYFGIAVSQSTPMRTRWTPFKGGNMNRSISRRQWLKMTSMVGLAASGAVAPFVARAASEPIKIGYPTNRSGVYAYLGAYEIMGAQLAVEEYNQQG